MRSSQEMLSLLISTAQEDPRIRAAYLEGSRVDPEAPADLFQDYDVVYVVTETVSFQADPHWIDRFGPQLYLQHPESGILFPSQPNLCWGWLIQLADGNRLDLHVCTRDYALAHLEFYRILLDKDHILPPPDPAALQRYWIHRPTTQEFSAVCNEFWWCLNNVAKGLWRQEIPYVMDQLNLAVRPMLLQMLSWSVGVSHGFTISAGKSGKRLKRYLPADIYQAYLNTYPPAQTDALWTAVFQLCALFSQTAKKVSALLDFSYSQQEEEGSLLFLHRVHSLSPDAEVIF